MKSIALIIALAFSLCGASVDFTHSTLYDINDFVGKDEVPIPKCDYGCLIYASTMGNGFIDSPSDHDPYAENLLIHDTKNGQNYSITDLSLVFDDKTSQKVPLTIASPARISVLNMNSPTDQPWPVLLYVVEKAKAAEFSYEVYDAMKMSGITINPNSIITVMSVRGFNLVAKKSGMKNGVSARLVGFDNALAGNTDSCPVAYSTKTQDMFAGFNLNIAGPIISLLFNERNAVQIDASIDFIPVFDLGTDGFITSGGYNGCKKPLSGGVQSFRSLFFEKSETYLLDSSKNMYRVTMDIDPNMDENHNVIITDMEPYNKTIFNGYKTFTITFEKTNMLQMEFINLSGDQGFLMRYSAEVVAEQPDAASSTSAPISSSPIASSTTTTTSSTSASSSIASSTTPLTPGTSSTGGPTSTSVETSSTATLTPTTSGSHGLESSLLYLIALCTAARIF